MNKKIIDLKEYKEQKQINQNSIAILEIIKGLAESTKSPVSLEILKKTKK